MFQKKILVLGYFGYDNNQLCGQTVKTRNIFNLIKRHETEVGEVIYFDTQIFQKNWLQGFNMFWKIILSKKLIYLPAQNNFNYLFPFIYLLTKLVRINIVHVVVGSWLDYFLSNKPFHRYMLKNILISLPQTSQTCEILKYKFGISNVRQMNNFRLNSCIFQIKKNEDKFKVVFMARINKQKGISHVFDLAEKFILNKVDISIDFFGQINNDDKDYFFHKVSLLSNVCYKGSLEPSEIYDTLQEYDVLVLPTSFPDEGFPGSILDAYIAGIPVIVTNWKNLPEFVEEGRTGFLVDLNNISEMFNYCVKLYENPRLLSQMKGNAHLKSHEYSSELAWEIIKDYI
jgi:glycosyltransferase involved in cell wall biosynthesis